MTSSPLFSKTRRADFRRELTYPVIYFILFFFSMPVAFLFGIRDAKRGVGAQYDMMPYQEEIIDEAARLMRVLHNYTISRLGMGVAVVLLVLFACVEAYHQFGYLHRSKEVDFYHGLPQTRRQRFFGCFFNGMKNALLPYTVTMVIGTLLALAFGNVPGRIIPILLGSYALCMLIFFLVYTVAVLAVVLTGTPLSGIGGIAILFTYFPALSLLLDSVPADWFRTYVHEGGMFFSRILAEISPLTQAVVLASTWFDRYRMPYNFHVLTEWYLLRCLVILAISILLLLLSLRLFEKRKMERAGEAMAYPKTERPIRIMLTAIIAFAGMTFMRELGRGLGWVIFGMLAALLIAHFLVELVYRADAKKIFGHKIEILVMAVLGIAVILMLHFDVFGYDRYLPKEDEVVGAQIDYFNNDSYARLVAVTDYNEEYNYYWPDVTTMGIDMVMTKPEDIAAVREFAKAGIAYLQQNPEREDDVSAAYYIEDHTEEFSEEEMTMTYTIRYTLRSGRVVSRMYSAQQKALEGPFATLFDSEDHKKADFPYVYTTYYKESSSVVYREGGDSIEVKDVEGFLRAYQNDVKAFSFQQWGKTYPIAIVRVEVPEEAIREWVQEDIFEDVTRIYTELPVYASFAETAAILQAEGIEAGRYSKDIWEADRYYIAMTVYDEETGEPYDHNVIVSDPADVAVIKENLVINGYAGFVGFAKPLNSDILVYIADENDNISDVNFSGSLLETPEVLALKDKIAKEEGVPVG